MTRWAYPLEVVERYRHVLARSARSEVASALTEEQQNEVRCEQALQVRRQEEQDGTRLLQGETHGLESGARRVADLQQTALWSLGQAGRMASAVANEEDARAALNSAKAATQQALATMRARDAEAKVLEDHRMKAQARYVRLQAAQEEEAALDVFRPKSNKL